MKGSGEFDLVSNRESMDDFVADYFDADYNYCPSAELKILPPLSDNFVLHLEPNPAAASNVLPLADPPRRFAGVAF
jgi:hypothetical protein